MKIVVNDIAASSGGALSILISFYDYIKANDKINEWIFLLSDNYIEETENIKVILLPKIKYSWFRKLVFDFITGRKFIKALKPNVVFSMQNIITFGFKLPQVVYVHQSLPFQTVKKFSLLKKNERHLAVYQYFIGAVIRSSVKRADKVIVQTQWMKAAVAKKTKIQEDKIFHVWPDINNTADFRKENEFDNSSFFYPTADNIYKNNSFVYKACEILQQKNIHDFSVKMTLENLISIQNIAFIGRISREQVIDEYNKSALIFPSYIETFGLPLAEARQMGTIILASNCPFSLEVLDGYENAYFFDPFNPDELAGLMLEVINGQISRKPEQESSTLNENSSTWKLVVDQITAEARNH